MGKLATIGTTPYRVGTAGNTVKAVQRISDEYGVDVNRIGHYSKQEVRNLGIAAKEAKQQADFAKVALSHIEGIVQHRNEINRLRGEAIKKGLEGKEAVDKYVLNAMLETHGHEAHIKKIFQDMRHGMSLIDAKSNSQLSLGDNAFQNKLREISAGHNARLQGQRQQSQMSIADISRNQREQRIAQQRQQSLMSFIRASDYKPDGSGSRSGWFSGWFS